MRFADIILRRGHLSERAIVDAVMTGERPAHLDRCELCADRSVDLSRWLDDTRALGVETADATFSSEDLTAQRAQIMRKLELLDEPSRVISFPRYAARVDEAPSGRRVAASWVAVAAAAGLVVGVVGGQVSARLTAPAPVVLDATVADAAPDSSGRPVDTSFLQQDDDTRGALRSLALLDEITPRLVQTSARGR